MKYMKNGIAAIRRVWRDAPNKGNWTAGLVLNGLVLVFLVVLFPEAFLMLNRAVDAGDASLLCLSIGLYALSMAGDLIANAYISYLLDTRHAQLQLSMRSRFLSRMFAYPFDGPKADEAEVSTAYVHALPAASGLVGSLLRSLIRLAVAAVIVFGYVAWLSPILLAFLLLAGMIRLLLLYRIMMKLDTRARAEQASLANVTNNITSVMQSLAGLKCYDAQDFLKKSFLADNEALYGIKKKQAFWSTLMELTNNLFNELGNNAIRLEQLKSAFRISYSLFDQIAFMINEFWKLGFKERQADAYHVFGYKGFLTDNVALTALYWAFIEFKEKYIEGVGASEKKLKTLRHALEHKFVQVHEYSHPNELQMMDDRFYHLSESTLKKSVLRILTLTREWIMELVYAIAIEESKSKDKENAVHLHVIDYDDRWKV